MLRERIIELLTKIKPKMERQLKQAQIKIQVVVLGIILQVEIIKIVVQEVLLTLELVVAKTCTVIHHKALLLGSKMKRI